MTKLIIVAVFLVGTVLCSDPKNIPCATFINGDRTLSCGGGYIFTYEAMMLDYVAANNACMAKGGFLASIRTQEELNAVLSLLTQNGITTPGQGVTVGTQFSTPLVNIDGTTPGAITIVNATEGQVAQVQFNTTDSLATLQAINATVNSSFVCKSIYHGNSKVFISGTNSTAVNKTDAVAMCTALGGQLKSVTKYTKNERIKTELALRTDTTKNYLIGLSYNATTMKFTWDDSDYSLVRNWCSPLEPQIPDTTADLCVKARGTDGCWFVEACNTPSNFICDFHKKGNCKDTKEHLVTFVNVIRAEIGKIKKHCKACRKHSF